MAIRTSVSNRVEQKILARNPVCHEFFTREAPRLASACREMAARFLRGGRLLAFGAGPCATDAQHVSVEFVHPVIVGKRALPALDLSMLYGPWLEALARPDDIVMGFAPPEGDVGVRSALAMARSRAAFTFALSGQDADYAVAAPHPNPFVHQEVIEILYHTLWETVHVFFEHGEMGLDAGNAAFLYPFLGKQEDSHASLESEVAQSILLKVEDDARLRVAAAAGIAEQIGEAVDAIWRCVRRGGKLILFGNGGSATDANDWAIDCVAPPPGYRPIPAVSLALEPANITAVANDVGVEVVFLRQLIAQARPEDLVVAISTSGGSRNLIVALEEARKRKMTTMALLGYDGGEIVRRGLADFPLVVRADYIPRIQEIQATIYHTIRETLEEIVRGEA